MKTTTIILASLLAVSGALAQSPTPSPTPPVVQAMPTPPARFAIAPLILNTADAITEVQAITSSSNTVTVSGSSVKVFPPITSLITTGSNAGMIRIILIPTGK